MKEVIYLEWIEDGQVNGVRAGELIRCKDCKYYDVGENDSESWTWCKFHEISMNSTDFCNSGKRKEE